MLAGAIVLFYSASQGYVSMGSPIGGDSKGFLTGDRADHLASDEAFRSAMGVVMGCGGNIASDGIEEVKSKLNPMWAPLPKNTHGRIEWRMLRYLVRRYFQQQSSLLLRGFEPHHLVNDSYLGAPSLLESNAAFLSDFAKKKSPQGFSLEDSAMWVAALEQLMRDEEGQLLKDVYEYRKIATTNYLDHAELASMIEAYMAHWLMNDDIPVARHLLKNREDMLESFPKWNDVEMFARGVVRALEYTRERNPQPGHARVAMTHKYSFEDAREAVRDITKTFASFWETECQNIKADLLKLDKDGTGRVSLKDFYGANSDGQWRFGESEAYLRELGALDESSSWRGKQVIIPNYMQGASNCISSTTHYLICCVPECEYVLNDIEEVIGSPVARPIDVLFLVGNMTDYEDDNPKIDAALRKQLFHIADIHGGKVPLHGRLFAQWLHYVFPRECPFPHKAGDTSTRAPSQYGDDALATADEVELWMSADYETRPPMANADGNESQGQWMSQWTEEEELIADYSAHLWSPWNEWRDRVAMAGGVSAILALVWKAINGPSAGKVSGVGSMLTPSATRSHFV